MKSRRLLVVEDDPRMRAVLLELLDSKRFSVTWVATAGEALKVMEADPPELALVDLGLPDLDGVALIARLTTRLSGLPVVVLTAATEPGRIFASLKAGARGYLFKEDVVTRVASALDEAAAGGMPMSPGAASFVLSLFRRCPQPPDETAPAGDLTPREREVVTLLARGLTYEEIGSGLGVSINTIRTHVRSTYEKLHATNKAQAIMAARREGWLRD